MRMWHSDGSNVSTLEKKTLKIYHVPEYLWDIENIRRILEENLQKKVLVGCQKDLMHQKIPCIARLTHLENYTEAVDLYLLN